MKTYVSIGDICSLNVKVILNDTNVVYKGRIRNAFAEIKKIKYDKVEVGVVTTLYA